MSEQRLSFQDALRAGWGITKSRVGLWLGYFGILVLVAIFEIGLRKAIDVRSVQVVVALALKVFQWYLGFNAMALALRLVDGRSDVTFADLFKPQAAFGWYLLGTLLYTLVCGLGLVLLIVPGIILALMFMFYGYVLTEKDMDSIEALKTSARLTRGHKGQLFVFSLAMVGVNLLGALALLVGLFATIPMTFFATAHIYRQLTRFTSETSSAA